MKPNELRIGNLVLHKYANFASTSGSHWSENYIQSIDIKGCEEYPDNYKPIPITEEWLLKFGFGEEEFKTWKGNGYDYQPETSKTERRKRILTEDFYITYQKWFWRKEENDEWNIEESKWINESIYAPIEYVHQLQNLYFALTGNELILK